MSFRIKISLPCAFLMFFIINISTSSSFCFSQNKVNKSIKKEVNGEVFIVTKGAGNIKLGLVTVYFLTEKQYKFASDVNNPHYFFDYYYEEHIKTYGDLSSVWEESEKEAKRFSIQCFVDSAKQSVINDKTNANGDFKVVLRNQKYWVYANSTRQVSDESEEYHWLFEYMPDGKNLFLSNDNMK